MNALKQLDRSTAELYARFGLNANTTPASVRRRIFMEEVLELVEASVACDEWSVVDHPAPVGITLQEGADVIVTVIGLLQAHNIEYDALEAAIERVIAKNDAKTHETHELVNGKITRMKAQP
jgi:NTP pyrophosphatase (non-canonical NTP hydrolase)